MSIPLLVPLAWATAEDRYGAKAANLARLQNAGMRMAQGVVLGVDALQTHLSRLQMAGRVESFYSALLKTESTAEDLRLEAARMRQALLESSLAPDLIDALGSELESGVAYVVRSSALGEDGAETSFAGQFDSILECCSPAAVARAVCRVWASLFSERAVSYSRHRCRRRMGMAVVIQRQVETVISGVMFTRDPRNTAGNELLVEYCASLGERLVSGQVSLGRLRIDRDDGTVVVEAVLDEPVTGSSALSEALATFRDLAPTLEGLFSSPQDVEWSLDRAGQLYVLQTRPITAVAKPPAGVVWSNANIAENFPEPVCPMLRSFVGQGYAAYFRGLGLAFGISKRRMAALADALDNLVGCQGGRLYYNLSNIHTVLHLAPGGLWLTRFFNQFTGAREFPAPKRIRQNKAGYILEILAVALRVAWRYLHVQSGLKAFELWVDEYATASAPAKLANKSPQQLAGLLRGFLQIRLECWTGAALAARRQLGLLRGLIFPWILRATQGSIRLRERARMKQALSVDGDQGRVNYVHD